MNFSEEQDRILKIGTGFWVVMANAGTGKTFTASELFVRKYLELEPLYDPDLRDGEHLSGEAQLKFLRNFRCITFTVAAARELDERILARFEQRGIEIASRPDGRKVRLSRTLDSIIQGWYHNPIFFKCWLKKHPYYERLLTGINEDAHQAYRENASILDDDQRTIMADSLLAQFLNIPLDLGDWGSLADNESWDARKAKWKGWWKKSDQLQQMIDQTPRDVEKAALHQQLESFRQLRSAREEFLTVLDLAQAKFYPWGAQSKYISQDILETLATNQHINHLRDFDQLARRFQGWKSGMLSFDFADLMSGVLHVFRDKQFAYIFDRQKQFPRFGIRSVVTIWDECQDNNVGQTEILLKMFGRDGQKWSTVLVGDIKQSIYGWRGASPNQFIDIIRRIAEKDSSRILSLSRSFRSARGIVALGNEICDTLMSYRDVITPSTTAFADEGSIVMGPRFETINQESDWVSGNIEAILQAVPDATIFILVRSRVDSHPLLNWIHQFEGKVEIMTIHRSKGLEADYVFVTGINAGTMPDPRSTPDAEANLLYVACTRARLGLFLSSYLFYDHYDREGVMQTTYSPLSPYFANVKALKSLALAAEYSEEAIDAGVKEHNQRLGMLGATIGKRMGIVSGEFKEMRPGGKIVPAEGFKGVRKPDPDKTQNKEQGQATMTTKRQHVELNEGRSRKAEDAATKPPPREYGEPERDEYLKRIKFHLLKQGKLSGLPGAVISAGEELGWIRNQGNRHVVTGKFLKLAKLSEDYSGR